MADKKIPRSELPIEEQERLRAYDREIYARNREKVLRRKHAWYLDHREPILVQKHGYYLDHREEKRLYNQQYIEAHREELAEKSREYWAAHREEKRTYNAMYYACNQEELQRAQNEYDAAHREERRLYQVVFRAENQDKVHAWQKIQRARKKNAPVNDFTAKQWRALCKASGYRCAYCQQKFSFKQLTQDHITPLSRGGSHTLSNIIPACLPCNLRKHTKDVPCPVQPFLLVDDSAAD